jgi:hypothetical protein
MCREGLPVQEGYWRVDLLSGSPVDVQEFALSWNVVSCVQRQGVESASFCFLPFIKHQNCARTSLFMHRLFGSWWWLLCVCVLVLVLEDLAAKKAVQAIMLPKSSAGHDTLGSNLGFAMNSETGMTGLDKSCGHVLTYHQGIPLLHVQGCSRHYDIGGCQAVGVLHKAGAWLVANHVEVAVLCIFITCNRQFHAIMAAVYK